MNLIFYFLFLIKNFKLGNWHNIQLIKMANLVVLDIDDHSSGPIIHAQSKDSDFETDTNILYIGGYPNELKTKKSYLENANNYAGCIRLLKVTTKSSEVQERSLDLKTAIKNGNVELDDCPTT